MKGAFQYTFDDPRVNARCWFDIYVAISVVFVMVFLRCTLNSHLLLMVLVILISNKFKDLFRFSNSMVYWIAKSCFFEISLKMLPCVLMESEHDYSLHIVEMFSIVFV